MHFQTVLSVAAFVASASAAPSVNYDGYKIHLTVKPDPGNMLTVYNNKFLSAMDSGMSMDLKKYPWLPSIPSFDSTPNTGFAYHSDTKQLLYKDAKTGKTLSAWTPQDGTLFFADDSKIPSTMKADKSYSVGKDMALFHTNKNGKADKFWVCEYTVSDFAPKDSLPDVDDRNVRSGWGYMAVTETQPANFGTICAEATLTLQK